MKNAPEHLTIPGAGLTELPVDTRDFSAVAVFGSVRAQDLPEGNFRVAPPPDIKDQEDEDFCTFYSSTEANEYQEGVPLEQYFNAYIAKVVVQKDPESWGCDLRTAAMTHVNFGAIELEISPFKSWERRPTRDEVLDPKTWDSPECSFEDYKMLAAEHRKNSLFAVDGPHDRFDNFRSQLWLHRQEFDGIMTGCKWRASWSELKDGIVPETIDPDEASTPHAFIICGQEIIEGTVYLVGQLSNGEGFGAGGYYFFPRSVINSQFTYGQFMFNDMPKEVAKTHLYYGTSTSDSFFSRAYKIIFRFIADLFV